MTEHYIAINIGRDDLGQRAAWDVSRCACDQPWCHGGDYLGAVFESPTPTDVHASAPGETTGASK